MCRRKRYNLPARLWWPTNPKKRHFSPDRRSTAAGLSSQRRPCGFQIERAPPFTDTHPPRPWLRSTSRWVSRPSPTLDARFLARLRGDRACPSTANVAVSSRRFALAHLSRPLRSDTRSPRRRRTPRRARSPRTCRTPRRSRSRWWTRRCSRRSKSCAKSARKPRRPARQRYDSSRDRDTAAVVFLFALASTWATTPAVSVPTRRDANRAARGTRGALETTGVPDPAATQARRARFRRARAARRADRSAAPDLGRVHARGSASCGPCVSARDAAFRSVFSRRRRFQENATNATRGASRRFSAASVDGRRAPSNVDGE